MATRPVATEKGATVPDLTPETIAVLDGINFDVEAEIDFSALDFSGMDMALVRKIFWYRVGYAAVKEAKAAGQLPTQAEVAAHLSNAANGESLKLAFHRVAYVALTRLASKVRVIGSTNQSQAVFLRMYNAVFDKKVAGDARAVTVNRFLLAFGLKIKAFWDAYSAGIPAEHPLKKAQVASGVPAGVAYVTGNVLWNAGPAITQAQADRRLAQWILFSKTLHTLTQRTKPWNEELEEQVKRYYMLTAPAIAG
jgi:hypothetical protein